MTGTTASTAVRSWLAVPIVRDGIGIGLVEVDLLEVDAFSEDDEVLLGAVVSVLAGAVEVAAHHDEELRASELRDAFIGVISHELRTPVTTIFGLARVLRRRGESLDSATRDQAIVDIEEEALRLTRLIEDLLVAVPSRARPGPDRGRADQHGPPRPRDRRGRARAASEPPLRPSVRMREPPLAAGESTYVEQVMRNLLSNADKYSPAGTTIEIELDDTADEVLVRVLDRGIGVDAESAARAFELFYRTSDASRVASGAGIGLFVCRQLIQAMGGRTWMAPREGGGTEVGFSLPLATLDEDDD